MKRFLSLLVLLTSVGMGFAEGQIYVESIKNELKPGSGGGGSVKTTLEHGDLEVAYIQKSQSPIGGKSSTPMLQGFSSDPSLAGFRCVRDPFGDPVCVMQGSENFKELLKDMPEENTIHAGISLEHKQIKPGEIFKKEILALKKDQTDSLKAGTFKILTLA